MKKNFLALLFILCGAVVYAQQTRISGKVVDENGQALFADLYIDGTSFYTTTDGEGNYEMDIDNGTYTLIVSALGYGDQKKSITTTGTPVTVNINFKKDENSAGEFGSSGARQLKQVTIAGTSNKESESALLLQQKKAVEIKQSIGAEELSRKGVSSAEGAVTKITGISKQEGAKNVFVRGLGDRYNSTTMNGLPLPSEDPGYKNIALDFFSSDIIKNIGVDKTFNSTMYGDVAGANIDVSSKELSKSRLLSASLSTGFNSNTIGKDFFVADGNNFLGTLENGRGVPITSLNKYDFNTKYQTSKVSLPINNSVSVAGGKKIDLKGGDYLSLFGVAKFNNSYLYKDGVTKQINTAGDIGQDFSVKKYEKSATQTLMLNAKYKFGLDRSLSYNSLYIHDNKQSIGDYLGYSVSINDDASKRNSFVRRQQTNNNNLFVNQVLLDYKINDDFDFKTSVAYNIIRGSEPDRKTSSFDFNADTKQYEIANNAAGLNNRFFSNLDENDIVGKAEIKYNLKTENNFIRNIVVGGDGRSVKREFNFIQFNHDFALKLPVDASDIDGLFNQDFLNLGRNNGGFDLVTQRGTIYNTQALNPFYYEGKKKIGAGYVNGTYQFNESFIAQLGVRYEKVNQTVEWDTNLSSSVKDLTVKPVDITKNYFLPSLNLKYSLNPNNIMRYSSSITYTLPQFKEVAPFLYEDVNFTSQGNKDLMPATNYNVDAKYDYYLSKGEIISLGGFYKKIKDPINRVRINSVGNELTYVNLGDATVAGLELELRKNILTKDYDANKLDLSFGFNFSYLYSNQKLIDNPNDIFVVQFTKKEDRLEGASPVLLNSDVTFNYTTEKTNLTTSLVLNYYSDRIYAFGTGGYQNLVEKGIPTLDFISSYDIMKDKFGIKVEIKNILNPNFKITQDVNSGTRSYKETINDYKKGINTSLGIYWNL
ncbi:MAG: TonB-dependent receptor [Flavobacteriales bacterium]|nr:TonB-dependent receptor [Flavobacteriales bacterium]